MSENNVVIKRQIRVSVLVAVWLLVFVLPAFIVHFSLNFLFAMTQTANKRAAGTTMINDMESFRRDLDISSFLQRRLEKCFAEMTTVPDFNDPVAVAQRLTELTGVRAAGLISHGADTGSVSVYFDSRFAGQGKSLSRNLMRRYLVSLNGQLLHKFHSSENEASTKALFRFSGPVKVKRDADAFLRRTFSLIVEMAIIPGRVSKSLSSVYGGSLYFFYQPFYSGKGADRMITGGLFIVMAGSDLSWKKAAADALNKSASGLRRSLARSDLSYWESSRNRPEMITRFHEDEEGYHLLSTLSQTALIDLIQQGTFMPEHLEQICRNLPLLKVSIPWSSLHHPLLPWSQHILFVCRLYVMLGALFLLRIFFFGVEFKAGIVSKVVTGTAFILLLPVILLLSGFLTWHQYSRIYAWYDAETRQQYMFNDFNEKFAAYQQELQQATYDLACSLTGLIASDSQDKIKAHLHDWLKNSLAADISVDLPGGRFIKAESENYIGTVSSEENSNRRLSSLGVFSAFNDDGVFTQVSFDLSPRDIMAVDSRFINDVISRWGRFYQLFRFHQGSRFSSIYLPKAGRNDPLALLTVKYINEDLLKGLTRRYLKESQVYRDIFSEYFIIREDAGVKRYFSMADNREVRDPEMLERFNLAAVSGIHTSRIGDRDLLQIFAMSDYPLILLTRINKVTGRQNAAGFSAALLLYALLLLVFVFLVFMLIYLRPIREFIRVTEKVAAGDYQCQVELDQTGEFGDLKKTFDSMIQGLEQRRRLTQFVSSEVMKAVESDSEESMAVGGERIEATVAFVQLAKLQHLKSETAPEEIFATLGDFIAAADIAASQHGGVVDKLVEDTLMLVFRADPTRPDHALAASAAVLDLERQMREHGLRICAGIASGQVVSGRIGSRLGKLDFTVIGDPVNLAARLKAQAKKAANSGIIIAPGAIRILKGRARVNFIERTELKGKSREYPLYELVALRPTEK